MTLLVVFGAGASYDSVDERTVSAFPLRKLPGEVNYRPPLAKDLFDDRSNFVAQMKLLSPLGGLVADLRARLNAGAQLEQELENVQSEGTAESKRELAALQFYLQWVLWECGGVVWDQAAEATNYSVLMRRLRAWRQRHPPENLRFVTFNYDTLLEKACSQAFGFKVEDIHSYVGNQAYRIYKLHGSVDWGRLTTVPPSERQFDSVRRYLISHADRLVLSENIKLLPSNHPQLLVVEGGALYPAIAIPVQTKAGFECPDDHLYELKIESGVSRLLVIGWRATEKNFLEILMRDLPENLRTLVVAGPRTSDPKDPDPGDQVIEILRTAGLPGMPVNAHCGFSDLFSRREFADFLA